MTPNGWADRVRGAMRDLSRSPAPVAFLHYDVQAKIGEGATAEVYRAVDRKLNRPVALKLLKREFDVHESLRKRFLREAQAAARVAHPNVVAVHDVGEMEGQPYLVMELVDGPPLGEILGRPGTTLRKKVGLLERAARGVAAAHAAGIVHRDLKPGNIMVGKDGEPKVADFGLAHLTGAETKLTKTGAAVGTPLYMAPEQVEGRAGSIGPRTDVYALGAILYEMLTGSPPHQGTNITEVYAKIVSGEPIPPRRLNGQVPLELEAVCLKALEKEPPRRYPTAGAFAEDLERWLSGEPVAAKRTSRAYRLYRRAKRNPLVAGLVALIVAVAVVAGTVIVVQWGRIRGEREGQAARETALKKLATLWSTIVERKRELRQLKMDAGEARKDLAAAVASVDGYIREWPSEPQGYYIRARGRMYQGDMAEARRDILLALERNQDFRPGWSLLGVLKVEEYQGKSFGPVGTHAQRQKDSASLVEEALDAFKRGWTPGRERGEAEQWGLAYTREEEVMETVARALQLIYRENRRDEARRVLEEAASAYRAEEFAFWLAAISEYSDGRILWLTRAIEWAPGFEPAYVARGEARRKEGDHDGALADFEAALRIRSDYVEALYNRAMIRQERGDCAGAEDDLTAVLSRRPEFSEAWNGRGFSRYQRNDLKGALEDFESAIRMQPSNAQAYANRGIVRRVQGDLPGAMADADRAIELKPELAKAWYCRGLLKYKRRELTEAMKDFDRALSLDSTDTEALVLRGIARHQTGDSGGAMADFDRAVELKPDEFNARNNRANLKLDRNDVAGAIADYDRVIELKPDAATAHYNRGTARQRGGDWPGALQDFNRAIELKLEDAKVYMHRGMAREVLDDLPGAEADFSKALERGGAGWEQRAQVESWLSEVRRKRRSP